MSEDPGIKDKIAFSTALETNGGGVAGDNTPVKDEQQDDPDTGNKDAQAQSDLAGGVTEDYKYDDEASSHSLDGREDDPLIASFLKQGLDKRVISIMLQLFEQGVLFSTFDSLFYKELIQIWFQA